MTATDSFLPPAALTHTHRHTRTVDEVRLKQREVKKRVLGRPEREQEGSAECDCSGIISM